MTVNEEREVFLRTISSYFKKNSNIPLEKEYIYSSQTQYVNDIVINGTHINRIYNKGEIYWGNEQHRIS